MIQVPAPTVHETPSFAGSRAADVLSGSEIAFLKHRVSRFGLWGAVLFGVFWILRFAVHAVVGTENAGFFDPSMRYHALAGLCLLALWALVSRLDADVRTIRAIESVGLVSTAAIIAQLALSLPLPARPDYVLLMALSLALTIRAIYVPSSWRRTAALCVIVGLIALVAIYQMWLPLDAQAWAQLQPKMPHYTPADSVFAMVRNGAIWWAVITVQVTAASHVIFGLRRDVRHAKQLGQYRLERKLGEGGMGVVFLAHHALLRRPTAVKLLSVEKAGERAIERFEREVQLMARLHHPNTVTVFDYGRSPDGVFYYAMELINGATLAEIVQVAGPMDPARTLAVVRQCAAAMVEAHGIGLIHRDIKPANIMVFLPHEHGGVEETVKVLDFGLVKEVDRPGAAEITIAGTICGTPQYMSPEAINTPDDIDARTDLYALGAVMFYLLTGERVFDGTVMEVCAKHLTEVPDRVRDRNAAVPEDIDQLVADCLEKDPAKRVPSALELQRRIEACAAFGEFSRHDAFEWWAEYADALDDSPEPVHSVLSVDLARGT